MELMSFREFKEQMINEAKNQQYIVDLYCDGSGNEITSFDKLDDAIKFAVKYHKVDKDEAKMFIIDRKTKKRLKTGAC